jgi:hypothetical protein
LPEFISKLFERRHPPSGLICNGVNHGKQILGAVRALPQQQLDLMLSVFAIGDIHHHVEHQLSFPVRPPGHHSAAS